MGRLKCASIGGTALLVRLVVHITDTAILPGVSREPRITPRASVERDARAEELRRVVGVLAHATSLRAHQAAEQPSARPGCLASVGGHRVRLAGAAAAPAGGRRTGLGRYQRRGARYNQPRCAASSPPRAAHLYPERPRRQPASRRPGADPRARARALSVLPVSWATAGAARARGRAIHQQHHQHHQQQHLHPHHHRRRS
eukprot:scaffold1318_cov388-Prasinococcus_capsulatus_cf.AAC.27